MFIKTFKNFIVTLTAALTFLSTFFVLNRVS